MATEDTQQWYVHAKVMNVRDIPTTTHFNTAQGPVKSKVISKLKRGTPVTILIKGRVKFKTADGTEWVQHSPRINKNGDKWVFITQPAVGWVAYKHSGEVLIGTKPPPSSGSGGPSTQLPDTIPLSSPAGLGFVGFLAIGAIAYFVLERV